MPTETPEADRFLAPGRAGPSRLGVIRVGPAMVGALVLGTGAALAVLAWWLVPPYLALMALILHEPAGRRVIATNPAGSSMAATGASPPSGPAATIDDAGRGDQVASIRGEAEGRPGPSPSLLVELSRTTEAEVGGGSSPDEPPTGPTAPKARRAGRPRSRKSKAGANEPAVATWVQVAPGKFVRVEPGEAVAGLGPGPHRPESGPAEERSDADPDALPVAEVMTLDDAPLFREDRTLDPIEASPRPEPTTEAGPTFAEASRGDEPPTLADARPCDDAEPGATEPEPDPTTLAEGDPPEAEVVTVEPGSSPGPAIASEAEVEALAGPIEVDEGPSGRFDGDVRRVGVRLVGSIRIVRRGRTGPDVTPSRRGVRPGSVARVVSVSTRSRRGDGRRHHPARAFPPRSPPRRGVRRRPGQG